MNDVVGGGKDGAAEISSMGRDALNAERRNLKRRIDAQRRQLRLANGSPESAHADEHLRRLERRLALVEQRRQALYVEGNKSRYVVERDRREAEAVAEPFVYLWSTPMMSRRLRELVRELGMRPVGKRTSLTAMAEWVMREFPDGATTGAKAREALAIAREWWGHERSSK